MEVEKDMHQARISVIIPAYNAAATIVEAVQSVLAQSWPDVECIVVNDGSTDDTGAVLAPWRDRITCIDKANGGFASARNVGMQAATGEWIAWLDADDIFEPDKLERQMALLAMRPELGLICSDFSMFDESGELARSAIQQYYGVFSRGVTLETAFEHGATLENGDHVRYGNVFDVLLGGNFIHPPTALFRKKVFEAVGEQRTELVNATDYEYFLRITQRYAVGYVDAPLLRYRISATQSSSPANFARNSYYNEMALQHVLDHFTLSHQQRHTVRQRFRAMHLVLARHLADREKQHALRCLLAKPRCLFSPVGLLVLLKILTPTALLEWRRRHLDLLPRHGH